MKKTIIGYLPAAIVFNSLAGAVLFPYWDYKVDIDGRCCLYILIFLFILGCILNLAFLAYALFTYRLVNVLSDGSTSEGIVSKGGVVTAIITLVIQLGIILLFIMSK